MEVDKSGTESMSSINQGQDVTEFKSNNCVKCYIRLGGKTKQLNMYTHKLCVKCYNEVYPEYCAEFDGGKAHPGNRRNIRSHMKRLSMFGNKLNREAMKEASKTQEETIGTEV